MSEARSDAIPAEIKAKLSELELELSEGDITQKGYEKKKAKLLAPYQKTSANAISTSSPSSSAQRKAQRRMTRDNNRYHSEIRSEAVMKALALNKKQSMAPMPSKRTSAVYKPLQNHRKPANTDSSSDDDSVIDVISSRENLLPSSGRHGGLLRPNETSSPVAAPRSSPVPGQQNPRGLDNAFYANKATPSPHKSEGVSKQRPQYGQPGSALADVVQIYQNRGQPPDLTSNVGNSGGGFSTPVDRGRHQNSSHVQSVRVSMASSQGNEDTVTRQGKKKKVPTATLR